MAGADDNVTVITDWMPNPSLRTMFSNLLNDGFGSRSFSDLLTEGGSQGPLPEPEKQQSVVINSKEEGADDEFQFSCLTSMQSTTLGVQKPGSRSSKPGSRSGLAERAARAGFSAPTINTAHIRSGNVDSSSSDVRSPYVMIPPGLSPATLLESPVFLSNVMAQPSPTTGKFSFEQLDNSNSNSSIGILDNSKDQLLEDNVHESFAFKPPLESSSSYFTNVDNKATSSTEHQPSLPSIEVSVWSEQAAAADFKNQQNYGNQTGFSDSSVKKDSADDIMFNQRVSDSLIGNEHSSPPEDQQDGEGDPKGEFSSVAAGAPAEDGYNWRKYGQKQVKGGEYPRSYYKCTHLNCQVKKKVERSHDGHIIEIIYKGAHNHPKPPPNRRSGIAPYPYSDMQVDGSEHSGSQAATDDKPLWTGAQEWRNDGPEASSLASIPAEFIDPSDPLPAQEGPRFESSDAIDVSSTLSNDEDEDDRATHGSVSLGCEGERDETESKRRKFDSCAMEMNAASRVVREPRVVVQTTSEVDILDDGYRWRKYGQKVVKGNPNPRSYYKCTNPGCTVRKHVERASHDLKSVITTYEGKHNHDVPAARNSGHTSSGPSTTAATPASQSHNLHGRPEPVQVQDSLMRFDSSAPLSTFGLPGTEQLRPPPGFAFGMGQPGLTNLTIAGLSPVAPLKMPGLPPVHPYMGHHHQVIKGGFMLPKGEPKEEPISENGLPMSNGASMYYQMMGRLPLGPQL